MESFELDIPIVLDNCKQELEALGIFIDSRDKINCGAEGCVYLANEGLVAKISENINEAYVAKYLMDKVYNLPPTLPKFYEVVEISSNYLGTFFLILREDVEDFFNPQTIKLNSTFLYREFNLYLSQLNRITKDLIDYDLVDYRRMRPLNHIKKTPQTLLAKIQSLEAQFKMLPNQWIGPIFDLYKWGVDNGVIFCDLSIINLGIRNDIPVLRDLGCFYIKNIPQLNIPIIECD